MRSDVPEGWILRPLAKCGRWLSGGTPAKVRPEYWGGDLPWVGPKDLHERYIDDAEEHLTELGAANGTRLAPKNSVLVVVRSMALEKRLQISLTRREVAFNQDVKAIIPTEDVAPRFLFYALWGRHDALHALVDEASHGTKRLRTELLAAFPIPLPPKGEQEHITAILGALDDKIDSNRRLRTVTGEVAADLLRIAQRRELAERTTVARLVEQGILEIGDGFRAKNLELAANGLPFARARNLTDGFDFTAADRVPESLARVVASKCSSPGDVAFTSKGTVGRFAFVDQWTEPFVYSPQLCFWRSLDNARLPPAWLYWWLQGPQGKRQFDALKGQTDMADYVSLRDQRSMVVALPRDEAMHRLAATLEPLAAIGGILRAESRTLAALRDELLPKLITGQIRAPATGDPADVIEPFAETVAATQ